MAGSRLFRVLAVAVLSAGIALAAWHAPPIRGLEADLIDARFALRGEHEARDVVVVAIDRETLEQVDRQWPYPRSLHARVIERLRGAGARTIAYDIGFLSPSKPKEDDALIDAAAADDVVLATSSVENGEPRILRREELEAGGARIGIADFPVDDDGAFRHLQGRLDGIPQFSVLAAGGDPDAPERPIDFAGDEGTIAAIPFHRVLAGDFDREQVRGKVAVVGATAPELQDMHPVLDGGLMSGPEVHANAIQTVLDGYPLHDASTWLGILMIVVAPFAAPLAALTGRVVPALAAGAAALLALLVGSQLAFEAGVIVPVAAPVLAVALGTIGAVALTYAIEVRMRRRTRTAFERFVPPSVVDEVVERDEMTPKRVEATVMFCDLRGFTALGERLAAEQVIGALNRYLEIVSAAVFEHGGTVVSYQGDGVLSVFGAPLPQPDHARRALAAAEQILDDGLPRFNRWLADSGLSERPVNIGIGLNSGPVMAGSVGSSRRIEYAAVGDATNVASRLQALSRDHEQRLFVADSTYVALGDARNGLVDLGEIHLAGRREPVRVWAR
jgi:adenylate cyclase